MKRGRNTGAPLAATKRSATLRYESAGALLDGLQFLARLEAHCLAGRDVDFRAGARIAPNAGLAWPHGEDAEAAQLDAIAVRQRFLHALEHGFNRHFGLGFSNAGLGDNFVDQVQFDHRWLRYVRSPVR